MCLKMGEHKNIISRKVLLEFKHPPLSDQSKVEDMR